MAIANYNSGNFSDSTPVASTTSDPITLNGLVTADVATASSPLPIASLSNNVVYQDTGLGGNNVLSLTSGIYNFTGGQLTLEGGGANAAARLQMTGATIYIGTDINGDPIVGEDFVLNLDAANFNAGSATAGTTIPNVTTQNVLLNNASTLIVDPNSRYVINYPLRNRSVGVANRNVMYIQNDNSNSQIRMTINMGRYANDVLYANVGTTTEGGPDNLSNSIQYYNVGSNVTVRDILYRGDYVDWRPFTANWRPLTGGGFIGDNGIKWLIENVANTLTTDNPTANNPLIFGSAMQNFNIGIDSSSPLITTNGNGYFELGLSPATSRAAADLNNRIVFINPTGITFNDRLALWNASRGRLRVENQTVVPFHISDDRDFNVQNARVVLHHFYPQYGTNTNPAAAATAFFTRSVTSTNVTGSDGMAMLGNDSNLNYTTIDTDTSVNRPVIVEALELNNGRTGTLVQRDYQAARAGGTSVTHRRYTERSATNSTNQITYDVFAFGHYASLNNTLVLPSASTTPIADDFQVQVQLQRDTNVTAATASAIRPRARTLNDVYDAVHNYAFTNRISNPLTNAGGGVLDAGSRNVIFTGDTTVTTVSVTASTITVPTEATLTPSMQFVEVTTTSTAATPVDFQSATNGGIRVASASDPTFIISGFNTDTFQNSLPGRLDFYDTSDGTTPANRAPIYSITPTTAVNGVSGFALKTLTINRNTNTAFGNMGATGSLTSVDVVYSRPGYFPVIQRLATNTTRGDTFNLQEVAEPYPNNADTGSVVATPTFDATASRINVVLSGGTRNVLTSIQTNRLLVESIYGSAAFNQYLFATFNLTGMRSQGNTSVFAANSDELRITTTSYYSLGYIQNLKENPASTDRFGNTRDITGGVGGILIAESQEEFDLQAIVNLTNSQTSQLQLDLVGFQGDTLGTPADDRSTLRGLRNEVRSARNIILGNI